MTVYPHLAYAEAIHTALSDADLAPPTTTATMTDDSLLRITCRWPAGHDALTPEAWPRGLRVGWDSLHGWSCQDPQTGDERELPLVLLADPKVVADRVALLAYGGPLKGLPRSTARWERAAELDAALSEWEDRPRW